MGFQFNGNNSWFIALILGLQLLHDLCQVGVDVAKIGNRRLHNAMYIFDLVG